MTVEERAKKAFDAFMHVPYMELSDESVMTAITQALHDQIENCAKIADNRAIKNRKVADSLPVNSYRELEWLGLAAEDDLIAERIRALAAPIEVDNKSKGD